MKIAGLFYLVLGVLISDRANADQSSDPQPATGASTKTLKYQIGKGSDTNPEKIKLNLEGSGYERGKFCRIMRSNDVEIVEAHSSGSATVAAAFASIKSCNANDSNIQDNCVVDCNTNDNTITYDNLSPITKYIFVYVGSEINTVKTQVNGAGSKVFGYSIPLLANPQITVSLDSGTTDKNKLKLVAKTCAPVDCPIYYKDIKYEDGTKGTTCYAENSKNTVDFDLLLPHYEVRCGNYPSFFYNMPNQYMKKTIAIYQPQFYAVAKTGDKVGIKFTNSPSSEICLFSLKDGKETTDTQKYTSVCGGTDKSCYAPCKYVELDGIKDKNIYDILIQTRHHDIKSSGNFDGYKKKKYAITEPVGGLLSTYTEVGVTFDGTVFKDKTNPAFATCTLKHYFADKIKSETPTMSKCTTETSASDNCNNNCATKLVLQKLKPGKAYMIEITFTGTDVPSSLQEQIFIRTKNGADKKYGTTDPTKTDTTISITAVGGTSPEDKKTEPTCEYLVSPAGLETFYPAKCNGYTSCRGICRDQVTIEDLEPNTPYDIRVIAHNEYDTKNYKDIRTELTTLTITHMIALDGLSLRARLNSVDPSATCSYIVQKKNGNDYTDFYTCPVVPKVTTPVITPVAPTSPSAALSSLRSADLNIARITVPIVEDDSLTPAAKSSVPDNSDTQHAGAADGTNTCSSNPLCSSIKFAEYEAANTYRILVTAIGKSTQKEHIIETSAPRVNPTDSSKLISVVITRDGNSFIVTTTYPASMNDNSKCKWELRNSSVKSNAIVKSCMGRNFDRCTAFKTCKEFKINDLPDGNNYYLTVYSAQDETIFGGADIQQGSKSSSGINTKLIIIIACVAVVVVAAIVGIVVLKKKRD